MQSAFTACRGRTGGCGRIFIQSIYHDEKGVTMKALKLAGIALMIGLLAACSTPEEKAAQAQEGSYKAQENVANRRLELIDKYQSCVKDAAGNKQKAEACDSYLRAAEALK